MTQRNNESLSAFIDGDVQDEKFLDTLCNDSELQEKWHRYHIIKDGLRNESPSVLNLDISANVMQALENEPTSSVSYLENTEAKVETSSTQTPPNGIVSAPSEIAPKTTPKTTEKRSGVTSWLFGKFSGKQAANESSGKFSPIFQQTGQFAVAASVAVAVILGVQQYNQPVDEQPFSAAPIIPVTGIQGGLSPVSLEQTRTLPRTDVSAQRQRLNAYLNDHNQQVRRKSAADSSFEVNSESDKQGTQDPKHPEK